MIQELCVNARRRYSKGVATMIMMLSQGYQYTCLNWGILDFGVHFGIAKVVKGKHHHRRKLVFSTERSDTECCWQNQQHLHCLSGD